MPEPTEAEIIAWHLNNNPQFNKLFFERAAQRQQQEQRSKFIRDLMGQKATQESEVPGAQDLEGPLPQDLPGYTGPQTSQGRGYLGGGMSSNELALRLLAAPTQSSRTVGGNILQDLLKPQAARQPTDYELWMQNPQAYADWKAAGRPSISAPHLLWSLPERSKSAICLAGGIVISPGPGVEATLPDGPPVRAPGADRPPGKQSGANPARFEPGKSGTAADRKPLLQPGDNAAGNIFVPHQRALQKEPDR